ncbi:MAG TPA: hypothetical protein DD490_31300 [Acidobacteria bacterium]|nr:hypothetical protein [Acidobacteriota bacterium]
MTRLPGVWTTPPPAVGWMARSVHHLVQSRFGHPEGLAHPAVRLLDPAAGPLNFVLAAWREAIRHRADKAALLRDHLLPDSQGWEILEDSCARGHRALRRFLRGFGALPAPGGERVLRQRDSLAGPPEPAAIAGALPVLLGNPPWIGQPPPASPWLARLLGTWRVGEGRPLTGRNGKCLQDTWARFLRLAQWMVEQQGEGIVAFALNHNGLDAPTLRGMRSSLLATFEEIYLLDLHGNQRKRERAPDGSRDENLFPGLAQGAALMVLVKKPGLARRVAHADLQGTRLHKLAVLRSGSLATTAWSEIRPRSPQLVFRPAADLATEQAFRRGTPLDEIFPVHTTGLITGQDAVVTATDRRLLEERLRRIGRREWLPHLTAWLPRPFDLRYLVFTPEAVTRPRPELARHLRQPGNVALLVPRQHKGELGAFVTAALPGHKAVSAYDITSAFPLYLDTAGERLANLSPAFRDRLAGLYGESPEPGAILAYSYGVLHAPGYRNRFRQLLSRELARIPFPLQVQPFNDLAGCGSALLAAHLRLPAARATGGCRLSGDLGLPVTQITYDPGEHGIRLHPEGLRLDGVSPDLWSYRIGDYAVLTSWLIARSGRPLRAEERRELSDLTTAVQRSLDLLPALERAYRNAAA